MRCLLHRARPGGPGRSRRGRMLHGSPHTPRMLSAVRAECYTSGLNAASPEPRRGSGDAVGVDQLLCRAAQQRLAAEGHAQGADLRRVDLVPRAAAEVGDRAGAAGQLLRNPGDLLLADVAVVAVERLPGDALGIGP